MFPTDEEIDKAVLTLAAFAKKVNQNDDLFKEMAKGKAKMLSALLEVGFTRSEAFQIVVHQGGTNFHNK